MPINIGNLGEIGEIHVGDSQISKVIVGSDIVYCLSANELPIPLIASNDTTPNAGDTITLTGSANDNDHPTGPFTFDWFTGAIDATPDETDSNVNQNTATYIVTSSVGGNVTYNLRVTDPANGQGTASITIPWNHVINGHSVSLATNGNYTQTVSGTVGAQYTTSVEAGTFTIPAGGSNTHTGSTSAVAACSGNSISVTISAGTQTAITASTSASDSNAMSGAAGTFVDRGTALSTRSTTTTCNAAGSASDTANPCNPTTTTTGTTTTRNFATYAIRRRCDNVQVSSTEEQTGSSTNSCSNTSATNTAYQPGNEWVNNGGTTGGDETITDPGTCGGGTETAGCCPNTDCTATDGSRTETYNVSAVLQPQIERRICDQVATGNTRNVEVTPAQTGLTRDITCSYTYTNPDTCLCNDSIAASAPTYSTSTIFGQTVRNCSYTFTASAGNVAVQQACTTTSGSFVFGGSQSLNVTLSSAFQPHDVCVFPANNSQICTGTGRRVTINSITSAASCVAAQSFNIP